ncbi:MAG: DNA polymerase III subunit epsilon [Alphaproteobacteria bacterium]|nr:DNA polymerase III subunit epsilon [Alphaproteobacteria bacterium]
MREIVLDTETTGLSPHDGHRIVEIGCLELINHVPTGREFHTYVNPERDMPIEAYRVHGLSDEFLRQHPVFADVVEGFLAFVGEAIFVIHNAEFDIGFLNAELARLERPAIAISRAIDTIHLARRRYPGAQASLDALCRRFDIDLSGREKHGALVDCTLLAQVYLELLGGKQPSLGLASDAASGPDREEQGPSAPIVVREPRPHAASEAEVAAHAAFLEKLRDPIWRR